MSITGFAIKKNRITIAALIIILFFGVRAYYNLPKNEDPGFIMRTAMVFTRLPGASAERVEELITDKIEKAVMEIPELDNVTSSSKPGVSIVFVNIKESYKEMRPIFDKLRRKIDDVRGDLPQGVMGPDVNDEYGDVFGTMVSITGEGYSYAELKEVADQVRDELLFINEAAKVEIIGAQEERVFVEYRESKLKELGISSAYLSQIISASNIINPGGNIKIGPEYVAIEPSGNFEGIDDIKRTVIQIPGVKGLLYLEDIADVSRGYIDPPRSKMRTNGMPSLSLAISLREGGNITVLGKKVKETISRLESVYPIGIEFEFIAFLADSVNDKIRDFVSNLLQSIAIVAAVMLLTLGIRTGLVVASLIPMAMLMSLMIMPIFDIGLDQVSLASLIIALGMLVDNSIVMSELIMVQIEKGKERFQAAVDAAKELKIPLLTSSLTTAAAFLPIFLAKSMVGEFTSSIFKVVTITLLSSWILSITMIPLFSYLFIRIKEKKDTSEPYSSKFYKWYRKFLTNLLKRRALVLISIGIIFFGAMSLFGYVRFMFFPDSDKPLINIHLRLPVGTSIEQTERAAKNVEKYLIDNYMINETRKDGIVNLATYIGEGAPMFILGFTGETASPEYAYILVNTNKYIYDDISYDIEKYCIDSFPDLEVKVTKLEMGPPVGAPVQVRISGKDKDNLFSKVEALEEKLRSIDGTKNITNDWGLKAKKLYVDINQARARRAGITSQDVAVSMKTVFSGFDIASYREDDKLIPVTLRSKAADRQDLGKLEGLNIISQSTGKSVPLMQIADVKLTWDPAVITRRNRYKTVTVQSYLNPGVTAFQVFEELKPWLEEESQKWELGYSYEIGGEDEASAEANQSITDQLPVAGFIIILLLVLQFNSFRKPLIILMTIPLGLIGVVLGLLGAGSYFGFMTLLGVVSLSGIVINNAIVLLDRIDIELEEGKEPREAVVSAAQQRLRPILLTTATTIGGLIPLWFGGGIMWEPMAVSIIFGLLFSTVLTLGVVPVLYSVFYRVKYPKDYVFEVKE